MFRIPDSNGTSVVVNEIYEDGFNITASNYNNKSIKTFKRPILESYFTKAKRIVIEDIDEEVIPTEINSLYEVLGGGLKNGLYVIGANPGMGKTSLMLHIAINLALKKHHTLFFSLDMSDIQTTIRLLSNTSYRFDDLENMSINDLSNPRKIYSGDKLNDNVKKLYDKYLEINGYINVLSIHEDVLGKVDNSVTYVESVEKAIKNFRQYLKQTPVVVIDFLQLLQNQPTSSYRDEYDGEITLKSYDRRLEMDKVIEQLKKLSSVYKLPIIVITSTNRSSYTKSNSYDNSDYDIGFSKESGNIEYIADVLIRLTSNNDAPTVFGGPEQKVINLNIVKSRFGLAQKTIPMAFIPEYAFFREETSQ